MAIIFDSENVELPQIDVKKTSNWITTIATKYNRSIGDISYLFCDDEQILEANKQYLQHDYYTDIITFDYSEGDTISGDILISVDTVKSNAEEFNTIFIEELHRVIIHGILHLCGVDDLSEEDESKMRMAEDDALKLLMQLG